MAPGLRCRGDLDLHADGELVLEDRQRLALTRLLEVCRFGENELRDANAVGRRNRQDRWNQGRIARRVRLNVESLRQPYEQRCSGLPPGWASDSTIGVSSARTGRNWANASEGPTTSSATTAASARILVVRGD
jgi:hypothetical protein